MLLSSLACIKILSSLFENLRFYEKITGKISKFLQLFFCYLNHFRKFEPLSQKPNKISKNDPCLKSDYIKTPLKTLTIQHL